ncbi:acyl-CoA thioesterase [Natranaeroarchaeum aerophilus]|uniref:Acyl-CoA thioesterase n=1 Tax=Natranaeroarchaeum aerophilus TaxID=2917711 RepID=A0AAE3K4D6_9EURY|nr:acyl-CoA thioesterase [Natranaeroarchaeum aerophilus]MCL9813178.1 acyl-CoA thioesterase [Natranaeroarchaeum aerophilus]
MPTLMDTYIENRYRVQPNHANNYETAHGGNVMKWMDEVGAMSAMRFAGHSCVTANVDELDFQRSIPIGDNVLVEAYVYSAGRTSVQVHLRTYRENPRTGECEQTTESNFVFVALENGSPTEVPELTVESERGEELHQRALEYDP